MKIFQMLKTFRNDESGAVTVDWVVLTAAIVGLGLVVMSTVRDGLTEAADNISANIEAAAPATSGGTGTTTPPAD